MFSNMAHIPPRFFNQPYQDVQGGPPDRFNGMPPRHMNQDRRGNDMPMRNQQMYPPPYGNRGPPIPNYNQQPSRNYNGGDMASQPGLLSQSFGFSSQEGPSQSQRRGTQPMTQRGREVVYLAWRSLKHSNDEMCFLSRILE